MNLKNEPLVSIILPTYGRPEFLIEAISSCLSQSHSRVEVIVVDDNGIDSVMHHETKIIVQGIKDDRIKYIYSDKNLGGSGARNLGLSNALGEFITFLDDDDIYYPNKIKKQLQIFDSEPHLDICICGAEKKVGDKKYSHPPRGINLKQFLLNGNAMTPMIMARKSFLDNNNIKFIDTPRFQDHCFILICYSFDPKVVLINECLYVHNIHLGPRVTFSEKSEIALVILTDLEDRLLENVNLTLSEKRVFLSKRYFNELMIKKMSVKEFVSKYFKLFLLSIFNSQFKFFIYFSLKSLVPINFLSYIKKKIT